jgi:hypothetical protein
VVPIEFGTQSIDQSDFPHGPIAQPFGLLDLYSYFYGLIDISPGRVNVLSVPISNLVFGKSVSYVSGLPDVDKGRIKINRVASSANR